MQRIYNLDKWQRLPEGNRVEFSNPRARNVRIEVNAPQKSGLFVESLASGEIWFLALVEGRDTIEFTSPEGGFSLMAEGQEGSEVLIYTADGADVAMRVDAPVSFTKIVERRRRNPELEAIMHRMNLNVERRLAQQAAEFERRIQRGQQAESQVGAVAPVPGTAPQVQEPVREATSGATPGAGEAGRAGGNGKAGNA